jgi:agmatine/peptidylarginine deiminase
VLQENNLRSGADLMPLAEALGIRHWIVFDPFPEEPTGHADVHVRFLRPDLIAVAWHADEPDLMERATSIEAQVRSIRPSVRSVRIPCRRRGREYASLVNWVQLGDDLLVPHFEITPEKDVRRAERRLRSEGFRVRTVFAPTLDLGGSIHCLTASVMI